MPEPIKTSQEYPLDKFPEVEACRDWPFSSVQIIDGDTFYETVSKNKDIIRKTFLQIGSKLKVFCEAAISRSPQLVALFERKDIDIPVVNKEDRSSPSFRGDGDSYDSLLPQILDGVYNKENGLMYLADSPNQGINQFVFLCRRGAFNVFVKPKVERSLVRGFRIVAQENGLDKLPIRLLIVEVNEDENGILINQYFKSK